MAELDTLYDHLRREWGEASTGDFDRFVVDRLEVLLAAIGRGGFDISPCMTCGEAVVCIPDGLPICEACAGEDTPH